MARPRIRSAGVRLALIAGLATAACAPAAPGSEPVAETPSASGFAAASPSASEPSPSASAAGADDRVAVTIETGGGPDLPTQAFGSLWVVLTRSDVRCQLSGSASQASSPSRSIVSTTRS